MDVKNKNFSNHVDTEDNDGSSITRAINIIANNTQDGIDLEYEYISRLYGTINQDWHFVLTRLIESNYRMYDIMEIRLRNGSYITLFFDITPFYGML